MSRNDRIFMSGIGLTLVLALVGIILIQSWGLLILWFMALVMMLGVWNFMRSVES